MASTFKLSNLQRDLLIEMDWTARPAGNTIVAKTEKEARRIAYEIDVVYGYRAGVPTPCRCEHERKVMLSLRDRLQDESDRLL